MTAREICQRFNISIHTFHYWQRLKLVSPPLSGRTRGARYGLKHVQEVEAHLRLKHNNVSIAEAVAFCRAAGLTLPEYVEVREQAIRSFGLGVA
jgi:DNA-binding transcriptional MerR regulator